MQAKSNMFLNGKNSDGFTMIELLIVIAIIGIVVSLAIGGYKELIPKARVKSAARELKSNLEKAKMAAVKKNQNCLVVFNYSGRSAKACFDGNKDNKCESTDDEIVFNFKADSKSGLEFKNVNFAKNFFLFGSRGLPNITDTSKVKFTNDSGYGITIEVTPTGRIKIN
ncbi:MAG: prepilin-type N-terminal cleavage/methylation domain-containing protein [Desulforegulaceae bacterium]|nr:prepilin-type N-terminal cleavage/methylation domain-containing protein [Desulforegulaceae bacterium]